MMARHPLIGDVRGLGLFLGIELVKDRTTGERAAEEAEAVMYAALSRGLSFKLTMGNILTLTPALTITRDEMDQALDIIEVCLGSLKAKPACRVSEPDASEDKSSFCGQSKKAGAVPIGTTPAFLRLSGKILISVTTR